MLEICHHISSYFYYYLYDVDNVESEALERVCSIQQNEINSWHSMAVNAWQSLNSNFFSPTKCQK